MEISGFMAFPLSVGGGSGTKKPYAPEEQAESMMEDDIAGKEPGQGCAALGLPEAQNTF